MKKLILIMVLFMICTSVKPEIETNNVSIGGHFLGLANYLWVADNDTFFNDRRQIDYAINLDVEWELHDQVKGKMQLQSSPGGGSFGFPGPEPVMVDLNLEINVPQWKTVFTVGSFDAPFGSTTNYLTNNANATKNYFFVNPLFYSSFALSPTGILNVVGAMASLSSQRFEIAVAGFNNLNENSNNDDGRFGIISRLQINLNEKLSSSGSFIYSREGIREKFSGWLIDSQIRTKIGLESSGYIGSVRYGDYVDSTRDDVAVWMAELGYRLNKLIVAIRTSVWNPDDDNGSYFGISSNAPYVGLGVRPNKLYPARDQIVKRHQVGIKQSLLENMELKIEYIKDDYHELSLRNESTDVDGLILLLQGSF